MKKWGSTTSCLESARAFSVPGATSLMVTAATTAAASSAAASSSISVTVSVSVPGAGSPLSGSRPVATAAGGGG